MPYWMNRRNLLILCVATLAQLFLPVPYEWVGLGLIGFFVGFTSDTQLCSKDSLIELGIMIVGITIGQILKGTLV